MLLLCPRPQLFTVHFLLSLKFTAAQGPFAVYFSGGKMDLGRGGAKSQERRFEAKSFLTAPAAGSALSVYTFSLLFLLFFLIGGGLFEPGTFFFVRGARTYFYLPGPRGISARSYLILAGIPGRIFFSLQLLTSG